MMNRIPRSLLVLLTALLFVVLWCGLVAYRFKTGQNIALVYVRLTSTRESDLDKAVVTLTSIWGGTMNLVRGENNVWSTADGGSRPIGAINVCFPSQPPSSDWHVEYAFGLACAKDWNSATAKLVGRVGDEDQYQLQIAPKGSVFSRKYSKLLNWKGDFWLLFWPFCTALGLLLLMGGCLLLWRYRTDLWQGAGLNQANGHCVTSRLREQTFSWICTHKLLVCILLFGLLLRILPVPWAITPTPGIGFFHHPHEAEGLDRALDFPLRYFQLRATTVYGNSFQYLLGLLLLPLKLVIDTLLRNPDCYNMVALVIARLANAFTGTACIYSVYRLAQQLFDNKVALLSAALVATSFYHVLNSAVFTLDVPMSFLVLVNLLLLNHALLARRAGAYVLLGVASGFLLGTKLSGGVFLGVPLITAWLAQGRIRFWIGPDGVRDMTLVKNFALYSLIATAVFLLFQPDIYLAPEEIIASYRGFKAEWVDRGRGSLLGPLGAWFTATKIAVGLPVTLLAVAGFALVGKEARQRTIPLLAFLVLYYGFFAAAGWAILPRYVIVAAPLLCILAACVCVRVVRFQRPLMKAAGVALTIGCVGFSLYLSAAGIYLRLNDTRYPASRYVAEIVPKDTTLGIGTFSEHDTWHWCYPRIDFRNYRETPIWEEPDIVIVCDVIYRHVLQTLASGKLGPNYVLDKRYDREWPQFHAPTPRIFRFYDELFNARNSKYVLLKTYAIDVRVPIEFPPPEIRIYKKTEH
jgi:hypothetical protein